MRPGDTAMGWGAVWQLALKQFSAEAVEIRILILLAAAFVALLIVVGLKHAFRAAGPAAEPPAPEMPRRILAMASRAVVESAPVPHQPLPDASERAPQAAYKSATRAARKSAKLTINRQRAPRPLIRRLSGPADADAPYSPLPPRR